MALTLQQIIAAQQARKQQDSSNGKTTADSAVVAEPVQPGSPPPAPAPSPTKPSLGIAIPGSLRLGKPPAAPVVAPSPGLGVGIPVATPASGGIQLPAAAPVSSATAGWDDLELSDFAPVGSAAANPNYQLPADHVKAPPRDLPADATPEQLAFINQLDALYGLEHDAELFSQVIRNLMMEMKADPAMCELISDDDKRAMVRGMREGLGVARQEKAAKAKPTTSKKASRKAADAGWDAAFNAAFGE